jgi:hypothetical protein
MLRWLVSHNIHKLLKYNKEFLLTISYTVKCKYWPMYETKVKGKNAISEQWQQYKINISIYIYIIWLIAYSTVSTQMSHLMRMYLCSRNIRAYSSIQPHAAQLSVSQSMPPSINLYVYLFTHSSTYVHLSSHPTLSRIHLFIDSHSVQPCRYSGFYISFDPSIPSFHWTIRPSILIIIIIIIIIILSTWTIASVV